MPAAPHQRDQHERFPPHSEPGDHGSSALLNGNGRIERFGKLTFSRSKCNRCVIVRFLLDIRIQIIFVVSCSYIASWVYVL